MGSMAKVKSASGNSGGGTAAHVHTQIQPAPPPSPARRTMVAAILASQPAKERQQERAIRSSRSMVRAVTFMVADRQPAPLFASVLSCDSCHKSVCKSAHGRGAVGHDPGGDEGGVLAPHCSRGGLVQDRLVVLPEGGGASEALDGRLREADGKARETRAGPHRGGRWGRSCRGTRRWGSAIISRFESTGPAAMHRPPAGAQRPRARPAVASRPRSRRRWRRGSGAAQRRSAGAGHRRGRELADDCGKGIPGVGPTAP